MEEDDDEEELDPRIQIELEKLNIASEEINTMELELDRERGLFRQILTDSTQQLNALAKKLGSSIDKARPYYELRLKAREAQIKTQGAALRFERACSQLMAAKEMVTLAEEGFFDKGQPFDPAWQEMLNHATMKVNEAEKEKIESEFAHMETATAYNDIDQEVKVYQKDLKRSINKSRPYFEMKAKFSQNMEEQKQKVGKLEKKVNDLKRSYSETLRNLERISAEIHQHRQDAKVRKEMGVRSAGVGAESPLPPPPKEIIIRENCDRESETSREDKNTAQSTVNEIESRNMEFSHSVVPQNKTVKKVSRRRSYESAVEIGVSDDTKKELDAIVTRESSADREVNSHQNGVLQIKKAFRDFFLSNSPSHSEDKNDVTVTEETNELPPSQCNNSEIKHDIQIQSSQNIEKHKENPEDCVTISSTIPNLPSECISKGDSVSAANKERQQRLPNFTLSNIKLVAPKASPEVLTPDTDESQQLEDTISTNSDIMTSLQKQKDLGAPFLRPTMGSSNTLEDLTSDTDTGSMASMNMLDDDQIQSMLYGFEEMEQFASVLNEKDLNTWKQMTLPAKMNYLEDYVKFKPLLKGNRKAGSVEGNISVHSADACLTIEVKKTVDFEFGDENHDNSDNDESYPNIEEVHSSKVHKHHYEKAVEITESTHL